MLLICVLTCKKPFYEKVPCRSGRICYTFYFTHYREEQQHKRSNRPAKKRRQNGTDHREKTLLRVLPGLQSRISFGWKRKGNLPASRQGTSESAFPESPPVNAGINKTRRKPGLFHAER